MPNQVLKDAKGNRIGEIKEFAGKLEIRDAKGNRKGYYDPKSNSTYNAKGSRIGSGNLLTTLL
ncbi:MAG: hypothetical protein IT261_08865 [Saprospiraceae bacterium]|nr:hypothetical protein [Saprospiraceae bacterium]